MTREQHHATRELERAQDNWLAAYGWVRELGGRYAHAEVRTTVTRFDALQLTRAQPLVFGSNRCAR